MTILNNYACYFSIDGQTPVRNACWSMLNYGDLFKKDKFILIDKYTYDGTKDYIKLIVGIINEIRPCTLKTVGAHTYIKYQLIGLYNNDLILLNFIRNLWSEPKAGYSIAFFKELKKLKNESSLTPLEKLTTANVNAVKEVNMIDYGSHTPAHGGVKVRKLPTTFYSKQVQETRDFLRAG